MNTTHSSLAAAGGSGSERVTMVDHNGCSSQTNCQIVSPAASHSGPAPPAMQSGLDSRVYRSRSLSRVQCRSSPGLVDQSEPGDRSGRAVVNPGTAGQRTVGQWDIRNCCETAAAATRIVRSAGPHSSIQCRPFLSHNTGAEN